MVGIRGPNCKVSLAESQRLRVYDKVQLIFKMLKSNDSLFSLDNLFFEKTDEAENSPDYEKSLDWYLPPAPLISEIPATQALEEEIENHKLLGLEKRQKMLTSNLKLTNENTNHISPTQKFQFAFPSKKYEEDVLNLGGAGNNDLSHVSGKLTYGSQKLKNHIGTEIAPEKNIADDTKLVNFSEDKGESPSVFQKRLFKISDNTHGNTYSDNSANLDSSIGSVKIVQREINEKNSWKYRNSKQKPQYSDINMFTARDDFSASEIREGIFKAPSFSLAPQPHEVQVAPIKALCSQRFDDWKEKFGPIGLNCKELTGDTVMDDLFEIQHAHIIMTTPEKWDSMTRKWRDNSLVQLVRLFLIDEVHVVKDENRGPTLEVVVSRMKTVQSLSHTLENTTTFIPMRFVAVSATIPNAEDIAEWLSSGERPAVCLKMDERYRPVKLRKVVLGFPSSSNQTEFKFDLALNYKIASVIQTYSDQKPALVFCATRKGVQQAASVLVKGAKFIMTVEQKQRLQKCAYSIRDSKLKVTTSTLAMGVNLPAHLVVIKSTMHYAGGVFEEYSETDILQMIGRAGRPQFDTTATAVIMTRLSTREKYIQMLACSDTVESSLHKHLIEHLNAEIVLHTITDVNIALEWIRSTLLYIRALKNPSHYELCLKNLNDLSSLDLITMDEGVNFKPNETGRLMAWYYITFETVKKFYTISGKETLSDLVTMIASCKEFLDVRLRINEKKTLNTLNKDPNRITIRHPPFGTQIKETVMYLPKYELEVEQIARYSDTMGEILVTIKLRNFEQLQTKRTASDSHYVTLIIGDADNQLVFKHKIIRYHPEDEADEMKSFLGIFDGIF
ncbi:Putative ATP-dependent DNA helicase HFM1 [Pteropus alecto]|uniref:DNA 3'-5' helicase n=1 Tax=Pteropus alecto TaxID=9402 RepID=L5K4Q9_PTEAL|nr:Putative ATP-dependent DNA helicase HFM1 [Pteropus alecto]